MAQNNYITAYIFIKALKHTLQTALFFLNIVIYANLIKLTM